MSRGDNIVGLLGAVGMAILLTVRAPLVLLGLPVLGCAFGVACYLDWRSER